MALTPLCQSAYPPLLRECRVPDSVHFANIEPPLNVKRYLTDVPVPRLAYFAVVLVTSH